MIEITETHSINSGANMSINNTLKKSENPINQKNKKNSNLNPKQPLPEDEQAPHFDEYA